MPISMIAVLRFAQLFLVSMDTIDTYEIKEYRREVFGKSVFALAP